MEDVKVVKNIFEGFTLSDESTKIPCLATYIKEKIDTDKWVKIGVGTDSKFKQASKKWKKHKIGEMEWSCHFYNVIAFTVSGGGRGYHLIVRSEITRGTGHYSKFDRLWEEVKMSVELAKWIFDNTGYVVEIHFDLNPNEKWESNQLLASAMGFAIKEGFPAKAKPDAPFASHGADYFVNKNYGDNERKQKRRRKGGSKYKLKIAL